MMTIKQGTQTLRASCSSRRVGLAGLLALCASFFIAGCDSQRIAELEEGVATEADVRAKFGEPAAVYNEASGARTFEYPRQPEGHRNYMITIAPDGKMTALRQVLQPANFAKVTSDLDKAQVRRLLGRPAKTAKYELKPDEEIWDWRFMDGTQSQWFSVTFNQNGQVLRTAISQDEGLGNR